MNQYRTNDSTVTISESLVQTEKGIRIMHTIYFDVMYTKVLNGMTVRQYEDTPIKEKQYHIHKIISEIDLDKLCDTIKKDISYGVTGYDTYGELLDKANKAGIS